MSEKPSGFLQRLKSAFTGPVAAGEKKEAVVVCPANQMPARVEFHDDQFHACSRLPNDQSCDVACASQLKYAHEDLPHFLERTAGKTCAKCSTPIGADDWYSSRLVASANTDDSNRDSGDLVCHRCHSAQ